MLRLSYALLILAAATTVLAISHTNPLLAGLAVLSFALGIGFATPKTFTFPN